MFDQAYAKASLDDERRTPGGHYARIDYLDGLSCDAGRAETLA